jgi:hypothetical protein
MTDPQLGDLLRRVPDDLDPAAADRILATALVDGSRRRRTRRLGVAGAGLSAASVVTVAVAATALGGSGATTKRPADVATDPATPLPSVVATTYPEGSGTEVPGGPVIETDRVLSDDAALLDAVRDLLPAGEVGDLEITRTASLTRGHLADRTRDGRQLSLSFDGAGVSVTLQRWDRYAAVGLEDPRSGDFSDLDQMVATTAREACEGAYSVYPPMRCTEDAGGWHRVSRPSQGAAMPDSYQELYVTLFTDDGFVVTVDSYNTPAEKGGPPVADEPVLTVAESLAMVRSDRWFVPE